MTYPKLKPLPETTRELGSFLGYCHTPGCRAGQFYEEENLSSGAFPALSVRGPRGLWTQAENLQGMIAKDSLCYVDGSRLVINGYPVEMHLSAEEKDCPKTLLSMGAYILIFPDKKYINTGDFQDFGSMEQENTVQNPSLTLCTLAGEGQSPQYRGQATPEKPENGDLWLDEGTVPHVLRVYCGATGTWDAVETAYIKVEAPGIGIGISQYDVIAIRSENGDLQEASGEKISGSLAAQLQDAFRSAVVWDRGDNYLILTGVIDRDVTLQGAFTAERKLPLMDFVTESGNRLWGCRYGVNREGRIVNEIYASKQGDFKNFFCFMGTGADSYTLSLGTDGPFTAAISFLGEPLFFKERVLHRVCGSLPETFTLQLTEGRGVEKGSDASLAVLGEKLYYKSPEGVCVYDGSLPERVSADLGDGDYHGGRAGVLGSRYYLSLLDAEDRPHLFVLDTEKGIWHREDGFRPDFFCPCRRELYAGSRKDGKIYALGGSGTPEGEIPFSAETGLLGLHTAKRKYVTRLSLRLSLPKGAELTLWGQYDGEGDWEPLGKVFGSRSRILTLPLRPRRCDTLRIRAEGKGNVRLLWAAVTETKGSDWGD